MTWFKRVPVKFLGITLWYRLEIESESYIDGYNRIKKLMEAKNA